MSRKKFIDDNNDQPSHELAKIWGNISKATILQTHSKKGYSYKKNFLSSQKRRWSKIRISRKNQMFWHHYSHTINKQYEGIRHFLGSLYHYFHSYFP